MNLAAGQALQRAIEEQPKEELFFDEFSLAATAAIKENVAKALRIFNRL
jgi:fructose-bisphosphate aldolase class II